MDNLSYFMCTETEPEVVEVPGVARFKDKEGNVIPLKIKRLKRSTINKIRKAYRKDIMIMESKKKPLVVAGRVQYKTDFDEDAALNHLIVESLVFPPLDNPKLMESYKIVNKIEMPEAVFSSIEEYTYITEQVTAVLGLGADDDEVEESETEELETVKN